MLSWFRLRVLLRFLVVFVLELLLGVFAWFLSLSSFELAGLLDCAPDLRQSYFDGWRLRGAICSHASHSLAYLTAAWTMMRFLSRQVLIILKEINKLMSSALFLPKFLRTRAWIANWHWGHGMVTEFTAATNPDIAKDMRVSHFSQQGVWINGLESMTEIGS